MSEKNKKLFIRILALVLAGLMVLGCASVIINFLAL